VPALLLTDERAVITLREVPSVFDAAYFRTGLPSQLEVAGAEPSVEIHLVNGQAHRARALVEAADGYAVLEVYQRRAEISGVKAHWLGAASANKTPDDVQRAVIAYESIAQIVITPTQAAGAVKIGFGAR
jgi:hypothetical protein